MSAPVLSPAPVRATEPPGWRKAETSQSCGACTHWGALRRARGVWEADDWQICALHTQVYAHASRACNDWSARALPDGLTP
jgi:hypothetical protein